MRAAGGLLWRDGEDGAPRVAIVHRPRRRDWSLPKGKLDRGEGFRRAALREVEEETGCAARLLGFAGLTLYRDGKGRPKLVLYWHMALEREGAPGGDEVDEVAWLPVDAALERLTFPADRRLLARAARRR